MTPIEYRTTDELLEELLAIETRLELLKLKVESIRNLADFNKEELQNNYHYNDMLRKLVQSLYRVQRYGNSELVHDLEDVGSFLTHSQKGYNALRKIEKITQ